MALVLVLKCVTVSRDDGPIGPHEQPPSPNLIFQGPPSSTPGREGRMGMGALVVANWLLVALLGRETASEEAGLNCGSYFREAPHAACAQPPRPRPLSLDINTCRADESGSQRGQMEE